jgi:hypothetical protein
MRDEMKVYMPIDLPNDPVPQSFIWHALSIIVINVDLFSRILIADKICSALSQVRELKNAYLLSPVSSNEWYTYL